jgi:hypothetical protein
LIDIEEKKIVIKSCTLIFMDNYCDISAAVEAKRLKKIEKLWLFLTNALLARVNGF